MAWRMNIVPFLSVMSLTGAAILPLAAQELVAEEGFVRSETDSMPSGWQLNTYHQSPKPDVDVVAEGERQVCRITFAQDHPLWCVSLNRSMPRIDPEAELVVSFRIKQEAPSRPSLSVAISAGPGCNVPCVREFLSVPRDGEWSPMTVRFPARALDPEGNVLEFVIERDIKAGEAIYLADVQVEQQYTEMMRLRLTQPVSGVVYTDAPEQRLAGVVRVIKKHTGQPFRLTLAEQSDPDTAVQTQLHTARYPLTAWSFDMDTLPLGPYLLRAELLDGTGTRLDACQLGTWRLDPTNTTTRVIDGIVYHGNDATTLLGTYHVSESAMAAVNKENARIGVPELTRETMLSDLGRQGLPAFFYSWGLPSEDFLNDCQRLNLRPIPEVAGVGRTWGGEPLVEQAAPFADDPRIFAWGGWDEPSPSNVDTAMDVYRDLKSVSPRKLVVTSHCTLEALLSLEGEGTTADLILMDIYRVNRTDADLSDVGTMVRQAVDYAKRYGGIAVGVAPQAFIYTGGPEPTPEQLRAQIYLGLVNGARAFFPYAYVEDYREQPFSAVPGQPAGMSLNPQRNRWFLPDSRLWHAWPRIAEEIASLNPVIIEDGEPLGLVAADSPIQWVAKHISRGMYLVAVNPLATHQQITFQLPSPLRELSASPMLGTTGGGAIDDPWHLRFAGYEVKVFRLDL